MTAEEAVAFQSDPLFETSILMRKWDELAKETNMPLIEIEMLKAMALAVLK
jgi:predicted HD phosphohydrolase